MTKEKDDQGADAAAVDAAGSIDRDQRPHAVTYANSRACFEAVLNRAKDYGMPHVKLPIEAAEQVLRELDVKEELYEALKAFDEPCMVNVNDACGRCVYCRVRVAIAKAEGKS